MKAALDALPAGQRERAQRLLRMFTQRYGTPPAVLAVAPGRVNLLGEHTDYNGLPVLPVAIDRSVRIAAAPGKDRTIALANLDPAFPPRVYQTAPSIQPFALGDWGNYHKAAVQGLIAALGAGREWRGGAFLVDGDIPAGAGLSSSSALVVASALAFLALHCQEVPFAELAELLPGAERYVGTLSGGMDQATSLLARTGHALRIDFFPLRVRPVPLPEGVALVVCHSLVRAEKSSAARHAYNRRVIECRLACRALERALGAKLPGRLQVLGELARLFPDRRLGSFVGVLEQVMPDRAMPLREVARYCARGEAALRRECGITADRTDGFCVVRRARHVLREGERVDLGEARLAAGDLHGFGRLMFASHESCRKDYEVSCPELDELVAFAAQAGAFGARLTGAGFGGCAVSLVPREDAAGFLRQVDRCYYEHRLPAGDTPSRHRFVLRPEAGARVIRLG